MRKFMVKKTTDLTVGDSFLFIAIYMAVYLAIMGAIMKWEEITGLLRYAWKKIKDFFKRLKAKLIG